MKFGLIGKTLGHSYSQAWFEAMFAREGIAEASYRLFPLDPLPDLHCWAAAQGLSGFNVTVPYKEAVLPQLDELDSTAAAIGAVNCVRVTDGRLIGNNTDAPAFRATIEPLLQPHHTQALILGTGGAAKAVAYSLHQLGIRYTFVSRHPDEHPNAIGYGDFITVGQTTVDVPLIINATPVGMFPHVAASPLPDNFPWSTRHLCYDLVYNPSPTLLMQQAKAKGATVMSGLEMLHRQAELSWHLWIH